MLSVPPLPEAVTSAAESCPARRHAPAGYVTTAPRPDEPSFGREGSKGLDGWGRNAKVTIEAVTDAN